jgi:HEAT repeat protein
MQGTFTEPRRSMIRRAFIPVVLAALGILGVLGFRYATRAPAVVEQTNRESPKIAAAVEVAPSNPPQAATPPPDVARLRADLDSGDPKTRAAAIAALAQAPKSEALPLLEHVLETGEPEVDRQIALRTLHAIALNEGDKDGRIRELLRAALYHGDDERVSQSAQAFLEDLEAR